MILQEFLFNDKLTVWKYIFRCIYKIDRQYTDKYFQVERMTKFKTKTNSINSIVH